MRWLNELSTTGVRTIVTAVMCLATTTRYVVTGDVPDGEWLIFLGAMAGVDVGAALGKRLSAKPEVIAAEAEASVRKITATANAVPPLSPKAAIEAGRLEGGSVSEQTAPLPVYEVKPLPDEDRN